MVIAYCLGPKNNVTLRTCVDYRNLSSVAVRHSNSIPGMEECIDLLGDAVILSTLDASSRYWQVQISNGNKVKTSVRGTSWSTSVHSNAFWIENALCTFQPEMNVILSTEHWQFALVHLHGHCDIFGKSGGTYQSHETHLVATAQF